MKVVSRSEPVVRAVNSLLEIRHSKSRRAFTLMEVMIAVAILFMCLFAVMALLSSSLRSARLLQQHQTVDTGTIAGMIYVQLSNTNQVSEGDLRVDLEDLYPNYRCDARIAEDATNGLCRIDFEVYRQSDGDSQLKSSFLMYLPNFKRTALGGGPRL